jgi:hypothetical protein
MSIWTVPAVATTLEMGASNANARSDFILDRILGRIKKVEKKLRNNKAEKNRGDWG